MDKVRVGIIGCGNICKKAYVPGLRKCEAVELVACADLDAAKAKALAAEMSIPKVYDSPDALIAADDIDIVVNLTVPQAHAPVNLKILAAGKHAYTEKPFAVTRDEASAVLKAAAKRGLLTGSAPDTVLGGGIQTCRKLIEDGAIGKPIGATAFMLCHGHESWHPDPEFYYAKGGGPMLDMGPYYITALVTLLGPAVEVAAMTKKSFATRTITSAPKSGKVITVETETHHAGTIRFANDAVVSMVMSFDVWKHNLPRIEIYGTDGTLSVPDPNTFGGPVKLFKPGADPKTAQWEEIPLTHAANSRGIGVADMAMAIRNKRAVRASGEIGAHVLDIMLSFEEASKAKKTLTLKSKCSQPKAMPAGLAEGVVND
ncbi:MAG: Gfo/Idh/MocA family oxidoreductase [Spirochaetes bacterium]|nr:Gfo/Idh/MocA family oxidoreductase [Spirochaetota bacterium]